MFLCHGFGEHLGWYEELATILVQEGVMVFGHDHQVSQKMVFTALSIRTSSGDLLKSVFNRDVLSWSCVCV